MNQNFKGPVNQVAGRDIINYIEQEVNERELLKEQLEAIIKQEKAIAWEALKATFLHPISIILILYPFVLIGILIASLFYPNVPFYFIASILILTGVGGTYYNMRYKIVVQGDIGKIYRQAKSNISICETELTRRKLVDKALKKSR